MYFSFNQIVALAFCAAPIVAAFGDAATGELEIRYVVGACLSGLKILVTQDGADIF